MQLYRSARARTGKIARLPHAVREALNARLKEGQPASKILPWLNALPEVRAVLERYFDGSPIIEQNLSRWRHGGYAGWFENQLAREAVTTMAAAGRGIDPAEREALTSQLALSLSARMVFELRKFDEMPEGPAKAAAWKDLVWSLTLLRRGEFYAGKLRLEQEKLAPKKPEAGKAPLCEQEEQEQRRQFMGLGGPHWNNFTQQWEGDGAAEMTERDEVERLVLAELRRRKEAKAKEEGGIKREAAAGGDADGAGPSSGAATPEIPAALENPGHPDSADISAPQDERAQLLAENKKLRAIYKRLNQTPTGGLPALGQNNSPPTA